MNAHEREIAVVGSGVVGLTTAVELLGRGSPVRLYTRDVDSPPASSVAPAMFTPYPGPAPERFRRWTTAAYARLCAVAASHPESGVGVGKLREYFYAPRKAEPWLGELLHAKDLPRREPFTAIIDTVRPHVDMLRYLPWLRAEFQRLGGSLIQRDVAKLDELLDLGHTRVVNCSGVGAAVLARDPLVRSMHGQVLHVPNDIGLEYSLHDDAPGGLVAYVFRYADRLVVGGTFDEVREREGTDETSLRAVVERARNLLRLDGHPRWRELATTILQARAARRPARGVANVFEDIRLEVEDVGPDRRIVHHYGHGRMGVTIAWATAAEAADACERALRPV
ncbi:MAG: FAD-binding oxidoreductase [Planctomycetes bacterium]|nr:FAD-binding oxidoreductase [Planctomycetota bacterium]